ncbi:NB-ARC domain-containing protein [Streptomyces sp. NPDC047082]|uniref:NB-ARC domain-containing protein n=1 Tax=Streptomyces sp. NPDC047082 TaxID=3155259 RepID=UPI0033D78A17
MEPLVLAAMSASIVEALSTDAWQQVRDRIVELFRHAHPDEAENVSAELEEARELILAARGNADAHVEHELTVTFQRRLQDLTRESSLIEHDVQRLLSDLLVSSRSSLLPQNALPLVAAWNTSAIGGTPLVSLPGALSPSLPVVAGEVPGASGISLPTDTVFDRLGPARMLPRDVPTFTGRDEEMRELLETAGSADEPSVCLLHGMPGVGKTALAVHMAHRTAELFPDGQLFINLRGHDPSDNPASPFQLLGSLLTAAGFPKDVQPESVHGRAGMWRSWLSSKRMMIILDDAADFGQVEPLLPGYPGCLTVVTSRLRLEAAEVTKSIAVNELAPDLSTLLFDRLLRHRGSPGDADNASEVARLCGNLPLALVFAASVLLAHPTWQVPHLVKDLSSPSRRLTRLTGDRASVYKVLNTSVRTLDDAERRFLRRLCMHPGPELEKRAAAVLTNTTLEDADQCLDSLYRHSLLTEVSPGRFRMHVLLSSYCHTAPAEEFADTAGPADTNDEEEARRRLVDYYRRTATAAYLLETQQESADVLRGFLPDFAPTLSGPSQAAAWLAAELDNLAACTQYSADHPEVVTDLATVVIAYLVRRGDQGIGAARELIQSTDERAASRGDLRAQALFAHLSGLLAIAESDLEGAVTDLQRAAQTSRNDDWTLGAARALYGLHLALRLRERYDESLSALDEAAELFAKAGDRHGLRKAYEQGASRQVDTDLTATPHLPEHDPKPSGAAASLRAPDDVLTQLEHLILNVHAQHEEQARSAQGDTPWERAVPPDPHSPRSGAPHSGGGSGWNPPMAPGAAGFPDDEDGRANAESDATADDFTQQALSVDELDAVDAQHVNFWFADTNSDDTPLRVAESRTGCFQVGPDHPQNLAAGERAIPPEEIPAAGLDTRWIVSSSTCELTLPENADPQARATIAVGGDGPQWNIEFALLIPPRGESEERFVVVTPQQAGTGRIDAVVMVDGDPYRELTIEFPVDDSCVEPDNRPDTDASGGTVSSPTPGAQATDLPSQRPPTIEASADDTRPLATHGSRSLCNPRPQQHRRGSVQMRARQRVPARETALHVPQEWQRPTRELSLWVNPPSAWWSKTVRGTPGEQKDFVSWTPAATASQRVREAQVALDAYWQGRAQRYNLISAPDIAERLRRFHPRADWAAPTRQALLKHERDWDADARSEEMRALARAGRQLFHAMFPEDSELHSLVKELAPGDRLRIHWKDCTPQHVPWPLLFRGSLPRPGQPVQAHDFLGLRLRISHLMHPRPTTRSLDDDAVRAHLMYWGGLPDDHTLRTAQEHALELAGWQPTVLPTTDEGRKEELSAFLWDPDPVSLIYVFCQAATGAGNRPSLRFGSTNDPCDVLQLTDMGDDALTDQPLVFINACDTSAAEHTYSNELQNLFLERGSRAYIGSECKVPTSFAARFASVFFHFLYTRSHSGAPTAAGEALAQARKFFWDEYRSIGGLFYSYVNDDQIFFAKPHEVAAMHRPDRRTSQTRARQA